MSHVLEVLQLKVFDKIKNRQNVVLQEHSDWVCTEVIGLTRIQAKSLGWDVLLLNPLRPVGTPTKIFTKCRDGAEVEILQVNGADERMMTTTGL